MNLFLHLPKMFFYTGSFLLSAVFNSHGITNKKAILMDNTTYQYIGKSGDNYYFFISPAGNCVMEHVPAVESVLVDSWSNHSITTIPVSEYNYLIGLLKVAVSNNTITGHTSLRYCARVTIAGTNSKNYIVDCGSDTGRTLDNLITGYKRKYLIPTDEASLSNDTLLIKGIIKEAPYKSKKGIVTEAMEYYFLPDKKEMDSHKLEKKYFIKLQEGKILKTEIARFAGKKVMVKGFFKKGLWDATDEQHASRYGDYAAIIEITGR
jgi:hypothetical protein